MLTLKLFVLPLGFLTPLLLAATQPLPALGKVAAPALQTVPAAELFAPGIISGPENDGSPTFTPDGNTLFFTRSATHWTVILESHKIGGQWSKPKLAPFSGVWPDSSPAMSPDGAYIIFQSSRPISAPAAGEPAPHAVSNLWRVDRAGAGWSSPKRLPDEINIGHSIWKPSIAGDGDVYFTFIGNQGNKRLYCSKYEHGAYQPAQPLPFSDGTTADVDPEIAPDSSFLVFCSSGRLTGDSQDHLYITRKQGDAWGPVTQLRYLGDNEPYGFSWDDEPHLGSDHRTLYFSSDRVEPVHFPRTREKAEKDLDRMEVWDNGNTNVWRIALPNP